MAKKVLIIQPHSDDALFSASHIIFGNYKTEILTIENNKKRVEEDRRLYEFIGIPYNHLGLEFDDQSFYGYHKAYSDVNVEDAKTYLKEFFGEETLEKIEKEILLFLHNFDKKHHGDTQIVVPWGVGHPMHIFVRNVVESVVVKGLWYYRDFPHSYKKRARRQVEEQLNDYKLLRSVDITDISETKWELARKFYRTQSGLLWFEQGYIKKNLPEEIYIRKS